MSVPTVKYDVIKENLRKYVENSGMSQIEISKLIGFGRDHLGKLMSETESYSIKLKDIKKLSELFGCKEEDISRVRGKNMRRKKALYEDEIYIDNRPDFSTFISPAEVVPFFEIRKNLIQDMIPLPKKDYSDGEYEVDRFGVKRLVKKNINGVKVEYR